MINEIYNLLNDNRLINITGLSGQGKQNYL